MTIKEYATSRAVSYEAVAKQVRQYKKKELKKHIKYQGRTAELDDFAIEFLDKHRQPKHVVMVESAEESKRQIELLTAQVHQLQAELIKKSSKVESLLEDKTMLIEDKTRIEVMQEQTDKELQEVKQELSRYQRTLFGLYRKI